MKKLMTCLALGAFATILGVAPTSSAYAQSERDNSTFTTPEPLQVGNVVLPPGTYLIRVVTLVANRNALEISNVEQTKVFALVLATPHPLGTKEPLSSTRYVYYASSPGEPRALRTWFPRDSDHGHDIVYPKSRAVEIAAVAKEPVIAVPDDVKEAEYTTAPLAIVTPDKQVKPYQAPMVQQAPEPAPPVVAEARPHKHMPKTASSVPLYAALGLLSLGGALALRRLANPTS